MVSTPQMNREVHREGIEPYIYVFKICGAERYLGKAVLLDTTDLQASVLMPSGDGLAAGQPGWLLGTLAKWYWQLAFANTALLQKLSNSRGKIQAGNFSWCWSSLTLVRALTNVAAAC